MPKRKTCPAEPPHNFRCPICRESADEEHARNAARIIADKLSVPGAAEAPTPPSDGNLVPGAPLPARWVGQTFGEWRKGLTEAQCERLQWMLGEMGLKDARSFWNTYLDPEELGQGLIGERK